MRIFALMKFGQAAHIRGFREEGILYCNPLSYFRSTELDIARSDPRDGIGASYLAGDVVITMGEGKDAHEISESTGLIDRLDIQLHGPEPNVFCMHALTEKNFPLIVNERNFQFGDSVAVVADTDKFVERLIAATKAANSELSARLVEYVDKDSYSGALGVFRKLSDFEYQSEYRISFGPGLDIPRIVRLGSLLDITIEAPSSEINKRLRYEIR